MFNPLLSPSVTVTIPQREPKHQTDPMILAKAKEALINRCKRNCHELIEHSGYFHLGYALARELEATWQETVWSELRQMVQSHKFE